MDKEKLSLAITKALAYTENGGKPNINATKAGKTGEMKSIFQFTPATWKNYSKQVTGQNNLPLNNETEAYVVHKKVSDWVNKLSSEGKNPQEISQIIASDWNAGEGEPKAYTGHFSNGNPSKGVNKKYGVPFDVPAYAKKVSTYTNQFLAENGNTSTGDKNQEALSKVMAYANQLQSKPAQQQLKQPGVTSGFISQAG